MEFWALTVGLYTAMLFRTEYECIDHAVEAYKELKLDQMFPGSKANDFFGCEHEAYL